MHKYHAVMVEFASKGIRKLPAWIVRSLIFGDLMIGAIIPMWGWWVLYRHTGKAYSFSRYIPIHLNYLRFCWHHAIHTTQNTGIFSVDWFVPPSSKPIFEQKESLPAINPCGTCINCCTTYWCKNPASCAFLSESGLGCRVYKKLVWNYLNCGRYPRSKKDIDIYQCHRFS